MAGLSISKESWPKGPGFGETPKRGLVCLAPKGGKGSRPEYTLVK